MGRYPVLCELLPERLNWRERASNTITQDVYPDTCPSELMPVTQPSEFTEPVEGLSVREVQDPDVFLHFFAS